MILQVNVEETEEMVWQLPPQQFRSHLTNVSETGTYSNYIAQKRKVTQLPFLVCVTSVGRLKK